MAFILKYAFHTDKLPHYVRNFQLNPLKNTRVSFMNRKSRLNSPSFKSILLILNSSTAGTNKIAWLR